MKTEYVFTEPDDLGRFNRFALQNGGSVYQTSYWADVKKAWKPTFFMGFKGETPVLCALCLERNIKVGKLWYCPDGFVCDLQNEKLIAEFAAFLKQEMEQRGICGTVIDPLAVEKIDGNPQDISEIKGLLKAGFQRNRNRNFYTVQPPVTVISPLRGEEPETFLKKCDKGVRHGLKAAGDGLLYMESYDHISLPRHPEKLDEFFEVMTETADRTEFIQRDKDYYKTTVTALQGHAVMDLVYCDQKARREYCEKLTAKKVRLTGKIGEAGQSKQEIRAIRMELEEIGRILARNKKADQELTDLYGDHVPEKLCLAVGITSRFGKRAICLYGGTRNVLRNTFRPTHYLNWHRIRKSMECGIEEHDLSRVMGDPFDEENPYYGLAKYKRSYNGKVTEYVGELYLISDPFRFRIFRYLLPAVKKIKNTLLKTHIKHHTVKRSNKGI